MIEYIKGEITERTPTYAVIETSGIGYFINISLPCYTALGSMTTTKLLIYEIIREDTHQLYGFLEQAERTLFELLIGVSGVGANTARMILSSIPVAELEQTIMNADSRRLKSVKGIGAKTAERIIVDLKDKIKPSGSTLIQQAMPDSEIFDEALSAMVMLGFPRAAAQKVMKKIFEETPDIKVEAAIKKALAMM